MSFETPLFVTVLLLGLAGGGHCLGMCGGLHLGGQARYGQKVWLLHLGRVTTYSLLGGIAGAVGGVLFDWRDQFAQPLRWLYLVTTLLIILYGLRFIWPMPWWDRLFAARARRLEGFLGRLFSRLGVGHTGALFVRGLCWGLLPCGLVYNALVLAPATASFVYGFALMLLFGLATLLVFTLAGGLLRWLRQSRAAQRFTGLLLVIMGVWALAMVLFKPVHSH